MRYRCLIIDHDDTAVDSAREVHHPAHVRSMQVIRPDHRPVSVEGWLAKNSDPGLMRYLVGELRLTDQELETSYKIWREFTANATPSFYPGFLDALADFRAEGGAIVVASHSEEPVIRRHYQTAGNGDSLVPDLIFGWDDDPERRKPRPYPVYETLRRLDLRPHDVLVVDDLRPGVEMARTAGVDAAAACWSHDLPIVREYMASHCVAAFATVAEFAKFILDS
jgi:beta-phosphoglucomutase-like phosphatase (HAD superfamily)